MSVAEDHAREVQAIGSGLGSRSSSSSRTLRAWCEWHTSTDALWWSSMPHLSPFTIRRIDDSACTRPALCIRREATSDRGEARLDPAARADGTRFLVKPLAARDLESEAASRRVVEGPRPSTQKASWGGGLEDELGGLTCQRRPTVRRNTGARIHIPWPAHTSNSISKEKLSSFIMSRHGQRADTTRKRSSSTTIFASY